MFSLFKKTNSAKNAAMYKITVYSDRGFVVSKYYSNSSSYLPMDMFSTNEKAQDYIDKQLNKVKQPASV